jgi:hypothetical protein
VLELLLQHVGEGAVEVALDVERGDDVRVGLAADEVVDVEHLRQPPHRQVLLQGAIPPPPRLAAAALLCCEPAVEVLNM